MQTFQKMEIAVVCFGGSDGWFYLVEVLWSSQFGCDVELFDVGYFNDASFFDGGDLPALLELLLQFQYKIFIYIF